MLLGMLLGTLLGTAVFCATNNPAESSPKPTERAEVRSVTVTEEPSSPTFQVEVSSPDTGCDQYADWWEVVDEEQNLLYRRVLRHSHVEEQPFIRSGGPVTVAPDQTVWVRVHLHPTGYSPRGMQGTIEEGFESVQLPPNFAGHLEVKAPLPDRCAF